MGGRQGEKVKATGDVKTADLLASCFRGILYGSIFFLTELVMCKWMPQLLPYFEGRVVCLVARCREWLGLSGGARRRCRYSVTDLWSIGGRND